MSAVFHVDLAASGSGHAGTDANPFSWADVRTWLSTMSNNTTSTDTFDGSRAYTSNGYAVEFRMRGDAEIFSQSNSIAISLVNFNASTGKILFTSDDVRKYGLPVMRSDITGNALATDSVFFSIQACNNLAFEFKNIILDINSVNSCTLFGIDEQHSAKIKFHNVVGLSRNASTTLLGVSHADNSSRVAIGFNTVLVNSTSSFGLRPLFNLNSTSLDTGITGFFGANYIARHDNTTYQLIGINTDPHSVLYYGGNRFGGNPSNINPYVGTGSRISTGAADGLCDYRTQGIENDTLFGGSDSYSTLRTSVFWPHNAGLLLNAYSSYDINASYTLGIGIQDAADFVRSGYDAGAFEKNHVPTTQTYHVDLATTGVSTLTTGYFDNPITRTDMLVLYKRLAPVVDSFVFVLRNADTAFSPIPELDLGPLSNNTSAIDRSFGGSGSVRFTGYRTHINNPPLLSVNYIKTTASCTVIMEKLKIDWTTGTDFMKPDSSIINTGAKFIFRNNIVRTGTSCTQSVVDAGITTGPDYLILGNIFYVRHTTGIDGGVFVLGAGSNTLSLNTIIMPAGHGTIGVVGSGVTDFKGNYINSNTAWTFAGAALAHNTNSSAALDSIFEDPSTAFSISSWKFTGSVTAPLDIISASDLPIAARLNCATDIRDCVRDASPFGSPTYDAGAYEYSYFVPQTEYRYADLARSGTGHAGSISDRWSYSDLRTYLMSLNNSANTTGLSSPVEINCVNSVSNAASIDMHDVEVFPTGSLSIRSENPYALAGVETADSLPWLNITNAYGLNLYIDSLVTKSSGYLPTVSLNGDGLGSSVRAFNTIFWTKHMMCLAVSDISGVSAGSTLSIAGIVKTFGNGAGQIPVASSESAQAQNIVTVFNNDPVFVLGFHAQIVAAGIVGITSTSAVVVITTNSSGITVYTSAVGSSVRVGQSWNFVSLGCGFGTLVNSGSAARTISGIDYLAGSTGLVAYSGFSGAAATYGIRGNSSVVSEFNALNGYTTAITGAVNIGGGSDSTSKVSLSKIAVNATGESVVVTDFAPIGEALNIAHETTPLVPDGIGVLSANSKSFGVDYDILRSLRSQVVLGGNDLYDAGPIEANAILSTSGFLGNADTVIAGITAEGYALNCRRDVDGLGFRIVGYAIGSSGYLMYAPNRTVGFAGSGAQALASLIVTSNTFGSLDQVAITFGATTVTKQYNTMLGWQVGADAAATCKNIAQSFRADAIFNSSCYCVLSDNAIYFYAKLFGVTGNSYNLNSTFGTASNFQGGVNSPGVLNKVWPETGPYALFDRFEAPDPTSCGLVVRLDLNECNKPVGQIAVIAEITQSNIPAEVGTLQVYAFANTPLHVKHNREILVKRVILQF